MFNKPNLFPKSTSDATSPVSAPMPRGGRLVPGGPASGGVNAGESSVTVREPVTSTVTHGSATSSRQADTASEVAVQASESRLIVGPDVKLRGAEILDCDTLIVEGRVEAKMDSRVIKIAEHGFFSGTVGIDVAEIHGRFEGELTARQQLIIHATGRVSGTIRYGKIFIEEGGEISGDIKSVDAAQPVKTLIAQSSQAESAPSGGGDQNNVPA